MPFYVSCFLFVNENVVNKYLFQNEYKVINIVIKDINNH